MQESTTTHTRFYPQPWPSLAASVVVDRLLPRHHNGPGWRVWWWGPAHRAHRWESECFAQWAEARTAVLRLRLLGYTIPNRLLRAEGEPTP